MNEHPGILERTTKRLEPAKQWLSDNAGLLTDAISPISKGANVANGLVDGYNAYQDIKTGGLTAPQMAGRVAEAGLRTATQAGGMALGAPDGPPGMIAGSIIGGALPDTALNGINKALGTSYKYPSQTANDNREAKARMSERSANGGRPFTDWANRLPTGEQ